MRKLFEGLTARLQAFVDQRDKLLLLARCRDEECVYLAKALTGVDEASQDLFWTFPESYAEPVGYVSGIVEIVRIRLERIAKELAETGDPPWPALPAKVLDHAADPIQRIQLLCMYLRTRIEDLDASKIVVGLVPMQIVDPQSWRLFLRHLTAYDPLSPWCHHMRFIAREPMAVPLDGLSTEVRDVLMLSAFTSTEVYEMDFSLPALNQATKDEIADPSIPLPDRMQTLLLDANVDIANKRWEIASEKLALLKRYYEAVGHGGLLSVTLNSIGEVLAGLGRHDAAFGSFERALDVALANDFKPVILNACLNVANLRLARKEWPIACAFYEAADTVATAMLNAPMKLQCLENIGWCKLRSNDYRGAEEAFANGVTLARGVEEPGALRRSLVRLRGLYGEAGMTDRIRAIDLELGGLPA